jgi:hypothetical protein
MELCWDSVFPKFRSRPSHFFSFRVASKKNEYVFVGLLQHEIMLSFVPFERRRLTATAVLLVVLVQAWLGVAIEDQGGLDLPRAHSPGEQRSWRSLNRNWEISRYRPTNTGEEPRRSDIEEPSAAFPSSISPRATRRALGGVLRTNDNSSLRLPIRPTRPFPTTSRGEDHRDDDVCSRYLDHFGPEYQCVSTATDFILQLLDEKVTSILLCNEFSYTPTTTLNLSQQTKTVICRQGGGRGNCVIDGSKFNPVQDSAFTASGAASLFFCGVDFVNFFNRASVFGQYVSIWLE